MSEDKSIKEYAHAQTYSQMYRFAWVQLKDLIEKDKDKVIIELQETIDKLEVPDSCKNFMKEAIQDAARGKPRYSNYFSMVVR